MPEPAHTPPVPVLGTSQCQALGVPPVRSWGDYRAGCLSSFAGGHRTDGHLDAFRHGMETIFNLLEDEFPPAEQCKAAPELLEEHKQWSELLGAIRILFCQGATDDASELVLRLPHAQMNTQGKPYIPSAAIASAEPPEKPELAQAEACVLGSMILDPKTIDFVLPIVKPADFFYPANRIIFEHLLLMRGDGREIGLATLNQELAKESTVAQIGGTDYLISLAEGVPSTANAEYYAHVVRGHALLRTPAEPLAPSSGGQ